MSDHERLTALDASFLHAEDPLTPIHVGALAIFEGEPLFDEHGSFRIDELRRHVAARLDRIPRFRRRPVQVPLGQGRPLWVDDPDFDVARHVIHYELEPPGTRQQLWDLCEELHMVLLDRDHPLWELWFVTGLDDGRVALVQKVHHALVDGIAAVDLASAILDLEPAPPDEPGAEWEPEPTPCGGRLLVESVQEQLTRPAEAVRRLRASLRVPRAVARRTGDLLGAFSTLLSPETIAPSCSLMRPRGRTRRMYVVRRSLGEVRATKAALGVTVNDVVLAASAAGIRALLDHRGEPIDDLELRALVPVSLRQEDEHGDYGNKVAAYLATLPLGEDEPLARLSAIRSEMSDLKSHHQEEASGALLEAADHLPPLVTVAISRLLDRQRFVNTIVTNVPGPPVPLYLMGAELLDSVPVVPIGGGMVMTIAILSYRDQLVFGIHVDAEAVPDGEVLTGAITAELDALAALAGVPTRSVEAIAG